MQDNIIEVNNLSKKFSKNIKSSKIQLKNMFVESVFGLKKKIELLEDEFYALDDITFNIKQNENVAIIGTNGSGKSTLLKVLNGIYTPDAGEVKIKGNVGSVLELSAGFKPELSGKENIYLKFALQGIKKEEVDLIIDDVISFSELESFMDTPLKHYSSGMKSKLGFAIVSSINPDILILDEVFAAGDKKFREKSEKRIKELYKESTMILVTHSMSIVKEVADRVIILNKGKLVFDGNPQKGLEYYEKMLNPPLIRKKVFSDNRFGVITTFTNAKEYLDGYFQNFINQTLDFKKHFLLTLVDNGSTDNSIDIIKKYQEQFPKNIKYIKLNNCSVSEAKNVGLDNIDEPWISFIDIKDKVNDIYFEEIDKCLQDKEIDIVSCNHQLYDETNELVKKHDLWHRFKNELKVVNPSNMQHFIEINVNSLCFRSCVLKKDNLKFNTQLNPTLSDGLFVNRVFIENYYSNIAYINKAHYHEVIASRKTINNISELEYGLLDLLSYAQKHFSSVPIFVQRYVIYYLQPFLKELITAKENENSRSVEEVVTLKKTLQNIFSYLDSSVIEVCFLGGLSHKFRIGYYNLYKENFLAKQICYVDGYDEVNKEIVLHYYYHTANKEIFMLNDCNITVTKSEIIEHNFFGEVFMYEKKVYIYCDEMWGYFSTSIGDVTTDISFKSGLYKNGLQISSMRKG